VTGVIAMVAIAAALVGALVIVADVLGRALFGTSVFALNEIISMVFAIAVAFTLPAGAALRVNLKIDLLAHLTGPRLTAWLRLVGSVLLFVFFALLAWRLLACRFAMKKPDVPRRCCECRWRRPTLPSAPGWLPPPWCRCS
jgi:C4-dicarboxylate transporter, DctM subunit